MEFTLEQLNDAVPFAKYLGIEFRTATPEEVVAVLENRPEVGNFGGVMHGGTLMSLADTVGSTCAFLNLPPDSGTTTTDSNTRFLRPLSAGKAIATARPIRVGRTSIVVETEITDESGKLVAKTSQAQAVLPLR